MTVSTMSSPKWVFGSVTPVKNQETFDPDYLHMDWKTLSLSATAIPIPSVLEARRTVLRVLAAATGIRGTFEGASMKSACRARHMSMTSVTCAIGVVHGVASFADFDFTTIGDKLTVYLHPDEMGPLIGPVGLMAVETGKDVVGFIGFVRVIGRPERAF